MNEIDIEKIDKEIKRSIKEGNFLKAKELRNKKKKILIDLGLQEDRKEENKYMKKLNSFSKDK